MDAIVAKEKDLAEREAKLTGAEEAAKNTVAESVWVVGTDIAPPGTSGETMNS